MVVGHHKGLRPCCRDIQEAEEEEKDDRWALPSQAAEVEDGGEDAGEVGARSVT